MKKTLIVILAMVIILATVSCKASFVDQLATAATSIEVTPTAVKTPAPTRTLRPTPTALSPGDIPASQPDLVTAYESAMGNRVDVTNLHADAVSIYLVVFLRATELPNNSPEIDKTLVDMLKSVHAEGQISLVIEFIQLDDDGAYRLVSRNTCQLDSAFATPVKAVCSPRSASAAVTAVDLRWKNTPPGE